MMFSARILISGFVLLLGSLSLSAQGPFAPAAGQVGSTAMDVNSSNFVLWATNAEIQLGWLNNSDTTLGYSAVGTALSAIGKPGDGDVISLGDGGVATLTFEGEIYNGPSFDFAIFENSFSDDYLELAHVEVSSDGVHFFRFPSTSLVDTNVQIGPFGTMDCTNINNLAGKYRGGFGTPFDLEELKDVQNLDIDKITHVRVVDVVGSIDNQYGTRDSHGNIINDPWPTEFPSSGFDLDGLGIMNSTLVPAGLAHSLALKIRIYPNPTAEIITIECFDNEVFNLTLKDAIGQNVLAITAKGSAKANLSNLPLGCYYAQIETGGKFYTSPIVKH